MGFAKSRPAAQRLAAYGLRRPNGPQPTACEGPAARSGGPAAQSWFSTVFLSSGKSKMDDGEFEFVCHFNHLNPCFCLLHVVQIRTFSFSIHSSVYRNR